jgi:hypothetical protein
VVLPFRYIRPGFNNRPVVARDVVFESGTRGSECESGDIIVRFEMLFGGSWRVGLIRQNRAAQT